MTRKISRRNMLAVSASAAAGLGLSGRARAATPKFKTKLHKAMIVKKIEEAQLAEYKEAGFDGVECATWNISRAEAEKARTVAGRCGMKIHSVMRAWVNFNHADKAEADAQTVKVALEAAAGYGADAILLVPCRVNGPKMPGPMDFDIKFNKKTGHLKRVVKGDNAPYQEYIDAHNHATDASLEALKRLAPAAEKAGVVIALENVWNNLWVGPKIMSNFVRAIDSPWVKFYYDVGNNIKYGPPEPWIEELGYMTVKLHIKDFTNKPGAPNRGFTNIREGDVNWPSVRQALEKVEYNGWLTIEGSGGLSLAEKSERLDLIIAGK